MVGDHTIILNDLAKIAQNNNMIAISGYPTNGVAASTAHDATGIGSAGVVSTAGTGSPSAAAGSNAAGIGGGAQDSGASSKASRSSTNTGSYNNLGTSGTRIAAATENASGAGNRPVNGNEQTTHADLMNMQAAYALQQLRGTSFDEQWIPQMLAMHDAKLAELTSIVNTINDSNLKAAVKAAIPKIRMHRDALKALNNPNTRK